MQKGRSKSEMISLPRLVRYIDRYLWKSQTPLIASPEIPRRCGGGAAALRAQPPRAPPARSRPRAESCTARGWHPVTSTRVPGGTRLCARRAPSARPGRPSATHRPSSSPGPHPTEADGAPAPGPTSPWRRLADAEGARKSRAETTADPGLSAEVFPPNPCGADTSTKMAATPKPARLQLRGRGSLKEPISAAKTA